MVLKNKVFEEFKLSTKIIWIKMNIQERKKIMKILFMKKIKLNQI